MTYKAIVRNMIRHESEKWVQKLLAEYNIEHKFTTVGCIEMENDKEKDVIYWTTGIGVWVPGGYVTLEVGGTADDILGICKSVIWDEKHNIIWMGAKETREQLGITEFKIA